MEFVLIFIAGVLIGWAIALIASLVFKPKPIGDLRVDNSDPDGPYLFLELEHDLPDLKECKEVCFRVKVKDYLPQK